MCLKDTPAKEVPSFNVARFPTFETISSLDKNFISRNRENFSFEAAKLSTNQIKENSENFNLKNKNDQNKGANRKDILSENNISKIEHLAQEENGFFAQENNNINPKKKAETNGGIKQLSENNNTHLNNNMEQGIESAQENLENSKDTNLNKSEAINFERPEQKITNDLKVDNFFKKSKNIANLTNSNHGQELNNNFPFKTRLLNLGTKNTKTYSQKPQNLIVSSEEEEKFRGVDITKIENIPNNLNPEAEVRLTKKMDSQQPPTFKITNSTTSFKTPKLDGQQKSLLSNNEIENFKETIIEDMLTGPKFNMNVFVEEKAEER